MKFDNEEKTELILSKKKVRGNVILCDLPDLTKVDFKKVSATNGHTLKISNNTKLQSIHIDNSFSDFLKAEFSSKQVSK